MCPIPILFQSQGTGTQWDWDTEGRLPSLSVPVLLSPSPIVYRPCACLTPNTNSNYGTETQKGLAVTTEVGHNGIGTQRDWDTTELEHNTGTRWGRDTAALRHNGAGTQRAGTQLDWDTMELGHDRTGIKRVLNTRVLGRSGVGTQRH